MFGESAILDDGRLVSTWASGLVLDSKTYNGPPLRCPDAFVDAHGRVWVVAKNQADGTGASVWLSSVGTFWNIPRAGFASRLIIRPDPDGCMVAFTTSEKAWRVVHVDEHGNVGKLSEGTIPTGTGGAGMRDWSAGARPYEPLDETLLGKRVRGVVAAGGVMVACGLGDLKQVVVAKGRAIGTLYPLEVDWNTLRLSVNGQWWCGVDYGKPVVHGRVPSTIPPILIPAPPPVPPEPPPMSIPNHLDVVKAAREKYKNLSGIYRAGQIVNQVVWDLRAEGCGRLAKSSGDAFDGCSIDVIVFKPGGESFDILGDAEGKADPEWGRSKPSGFADLARWRAAVDPATVNGGTNPPPPPPPPQSQLDAIEDKLDALLLAVAKQSDLISAQNVRLQAVETALKTPPPIQVVTPPVTFPNYKGSVPLVGSITLKPEPEK